MLRLVGAALVVAGCGGCGFSMAAAQKREEGELRRLLRALEYMQCELQFRGSPLPELCAHAGQAVGGTVGKVLSGLSELLDQQVQPDAMGCMERALASFPDLPASIREVLSLMGSTLGRFDLEGQCQGLNAAGEVCLESIRALSQNRDSRLRGYQTLGLCAGAALAILFL